METEEKQDCIHFSNKDATKLSRAVFPTIRKSPIYGTEGDRLLVVGGEDREKLGYAKIVAKEPDTILNMPAHFLTYDTDKHTVKYAIESLKSHWRDPPNNADRIYVYWLKWVDEVSDNE